MARPLRVLIAGAYGTFGRLLVRELLATTDAHLLLAGRSASRAAALAHEVGDTRVEPLALDLTDHAAVTRAAAGCFAVACAAGPFQRLDPRLPSIAVGAAAHWLDIADDPAWIHALLQDHALDAAARTAARAVLPGQSSVPALAGALAQSCLLRTPSPRAARVTLFIGSRNPKGVAAVASALETGLDVPATVSLPGGAYTSYRFGAAHAALMTAALGLPTELRVAFESRLGGRIAALASRVTRRLPAASRHRLARLLTAIALPSVGSSGGCLHAEVSDTDGRHHSATLSSADQRLAILPCALAGESLLKGSLDQLGVLHPWTWLQPDEWIARLEARGIRLCTS